MTSPLPARPGILTGYTFNAALLAELARRGELLGHMAKPLPEAIPAGTAERTHILVTTGSYGAGPALMDALPNLRLISCLGSGYDAIDVAAARQRRIRVTHSPGANAACVADLALGLLIATTRRIGFGDRYIRAGKWDSRGQGRYGRIGGLGGARLGILGLGAIGRLIAQRAEAFGMQIGYHNRSRQSDVAWPYFDSALELAAWSDHFMVALRADASNRHIVNAELLRALGPRGHLVNISRGVAVDEAALAAALRQGVIEGAALDVFEREPIVHPDLLTLDNIVLTPHLGGGTERAIAAMSDMVLSNIDAFIAGRALTSPIVELRDL